MSESYVEKFMSTARRTLNCRNCGAPPRRLENCEYCGTVNETLLTVWHARNRSLGIFQSADLLPTPTPGQKMTI